MAKRRVRKFKKRTQRWSSNMQEITTQVLEANSGTWFGTATLATNPTQTTLGVSQIYTVKNFDINFVIDTNVQESLNNIENICSYIMFVPQGMNVTSDYNLQHPEYILNYKYLGSPSSDGEQQYQPTRLRTRLARKLQTGDSIILFIKGRNQSNSDLTLSLNGLIRWWTKAN